MMAQVTVWKRNGKGFVPVQYSTMEEAVEMGLKPEMRRNRLRRNVNNISSRIYSIAETFLGSCRDTAEVITP